MATIGRPISTSSLLEFTEILSAVPRSLLSANLNKVEQKAYFCSLFDTKICILKFLSNIYQNSSCKNFFQNLARSYKINFFWQESYKITLAQKKKHRKAQKTQSFSSLHAKSFQSHFRVEKIRKIKEQGHQVDNNLIFMFSKR